VGRRDFAVFFARDNLVPGAQSGLFVYGKGVVDRMTMISNKVVLACAGIDQRL
jgi:hypothetical protein